MLALHHQAISFQGFWLPGSHRIWPSLSTMFLVVVLIVVADETSAAPDVVGFFLLLFDGLAVSGVSGGVRGIWTLTVLRGACSGSRCCCQSGELQRPTRILTPKIIKEYI